MFFFLFLCLYFRANSLVISLFAFVLFSEIRSSQCSPGWSQIHHPSASCSLPLWDLQTWDTKPSPPNPFYYYFCQVQNKDSPAAVWLGQHSINRLVQGTFTLARTWNCPFYPFGDCS